MVYECRQAVKIPIIGMGGIADARDAVEFMIAGASAVQVGTANFVDPFIWSKLLQGIEDYMRRHKLERIADIVGALDTAMRSASGAGPDADMKQQLVALDVDTTAEAVALAGQLRGSVGGFKIGNRLFTGEGPAVVEAIVARGDWVFLHFKYHDIPQTVAGRHRGVELRHARVQAREPRVVVAGVAVVAADAQRLARAPRRWSRRARPRRRRAPWWASG